MGITQRDNEKHGEAPNNGAPLTSVGVSLYSRRKKNVLAIILNVALVFITLVLAGEIIFNSLYTGLYVVHSSMYPTLVGASSIDSPGGDYIYISKNARPGYGDIVVVYDENKKTNIIKRVVAFGGDGVKIVEGNLWLRRSGEDEFIKVDEYYVSPLCNIDGVNVNKDYFNYPADGTAEHVVAESCMFLLGDNRNDSSDSRDAANGKNGDYNLKFLVGVVPYWSIKYKNISTAWHTFFSFTLHGKSMGGLQSAQLSNV